MTALKMSQRLEKVINSPAQAPFAALAVDLDP